MPIDDDEEEELVEENSEDDNEDEEEEEPEDYVLPKKPASVLIQGRLDLDEPNRDVSTVSSGVCVIVEGCY